MQTHKRKLKLPIPKPLDPREAKRRDKAIERILEIRARMKPIPGNVADWIREDREDLDR